MRVCLMRDLEFSNAAAHLTKTQLPENGINYANQPLTPINAAVYLSNPKHCLYVL